MIVGHRMGFVVVENHEIALILVQPLDRLQELISGSLELPVLIHTARAIDDVYERLPVAADAKELGRRLATRPVALAAATMPGATSAAGARLSEVAERSQSAKRSRFRCG